MRSHVKCLGHAFQTFNFDPICYGTVSVLSVAASCALGVVEHPTNKYQISTNGILSFMNVRICGWVAALTRHSHVRPTGLP
eukprot:COSAG02_NODE_81_length_39811_cov_51.728898_34_plen_81_part_00